MYIYIDIHWNTTVHGRVCACVCVSRIGSRYADGGGACACWLHIRNSCCKLLQRPSQMNVIWNQSTVALLPVPPMRHPARNPSVLLTWIQSTLQLCHSKQQMPPGLMEWFSHLSQWYRRIRHLVKPGISLREHTLPEPEWEFLAVAKTLLFCLPLDSMHAEVSRECAGSWNPVFKGLVSLQRTGPCESSNFLVRVPGHGDYQMNLDDDEPFAHEEKWDTCGNYELGFLLADQLWISFHWCNAEIAKALQQRHFTQMFLQNTSRHMDKVVPSLSTCWDHLTKYDAM